MSAFRVLSQPRWAFWNYEEAYEFETGASEGLAGQIAAFFEQYGATLHTIEETTVAFTRGSALGSLFSPIERHHKHSGTVTIQPAASGTTVRCTYSCWDPYPNLHVDPRPLQTEVERLEAKLSGAVAPGSRPLPGGPSTARAPAWVWVFVALCVLIPVSSLGGAVPGAIGGGSALACYAVGSNAKRSMTSRAVLCVAITLGAWSVFLAFAAVWTLTHGGG